MNKLIENHNNIIFESIKQLADEYLDSIHKKKANIIESMLNKCLIETRNIDGNLLNFNDIKRQMEIMGCNIEIKEQNDIEIITLWINSWKEEEYKIIKDYKNLSFKIKKVI